MKRKKRPYRQNRAEVVDLPQPIRVPGNSRFREGITVIIYGFRREKNFVTGQWITVAELKAERDYTKDGKTKTHTFSVSDWVTIMCYADDYAHLHNLPLNFKYQYGKRGKPAAVYNEPNWIDC